MPEAAASCDVGTYFGKYFLMKKLAATADVLVEAPGRVTPGHEVPDADLLAAVSEVHAG